MSTPDLESILGKKNRGEKPDEVMKQRVLEYMREHTTLPHRIFFAIHLTRTISLMTEENPSCLGDLLPRAFEYNMQGTTMVQEEMKRAKPFLAPRDLIIMQAFFHSHGAETSRIQSDQSQKDQEKLAHIVDWYAHKKEAGEIASPVHRLNAARFFWDAHKAASTGQAFAERIGDDEYGSFFMNERYVMADQAASHFNGAEPVMYAIANLGAGDAIYHIFTKARDKRSAQAVKKHYGAFLKEYYGNPKAFPVRTSRMDEVQRAEKRMRQALKELGEVNRYPVSRKRRRALGG